MRKPKLEFDITNSVSDFVHKRKAEFETKIILYVLKNKGLEKGFNHAKFKREMESVKNWSVKIHTLRYDGIFIFRRFNTGLNGLQYRYEIEEN